MKTSHVIMNLWGRQGALDSEITCYLLEFNKERIANVIELLHDLSINNQNKATIDQIKNNMEGIDHFKTLALQLNHRTKSWAIQTCVKKQMGTQVFCYESFYRSGRRQGKSNVFRVLSVMLLDLFPNH